MWVNKINKKLGNYVMIYKIFRLLLPISWPIVIILSIFFFLNAPLYSQEINGAQRKLIAQAFSLLENNKFKEAFELVKKTNIPLLLNLFDWYALTDPQAPISYSMASNFLQLNTNWPSQAVITKKVEDKLIPKLALEARLEWFENFPPDNLTSYQLYALALLEKSPKTPSPLFLMVVRKGWQTTLGSADERKNYLRNFQKFLRSEDHERRLEKLLWTKEALAINELKPFVTPYYQALINLYDAVRHKQSSVPNLINKLPALVLKTPIVTYLQAKWYRQQENEFKAAEVILLSPIKINFNSLLWQEAQMIVRGLLKKNSYAMAYQLIRNHDEKRGVIFAEAEWMSGWIAYEYNEKPSIAIEHFTKLYNQSKSPISQARAAYWNGRAYATAKNMQESEKWYRLASQYQTTFYGQLAVYKINRGLSRLSLKETPLEIIPHEKDFFYQQKLVQLIKLLSLVNKSDLVDPFFYYLLSENNQNLAQIKLLAMLALEIKRPDLALSAARIAYSQGAIFLNYLYPVYFKQFIGQEPAIILAIIRQESSFNPLIVSDKGAHGVMQLLPSTAKGVAKKLSVAYQRSKLFQPDYNIKLGKQYLLSLLTRWERSYILAIASYNAGPGNVKNWIDTFGDPRDPSIDPILWIENIPFAETRNYVQRVLEAAEVYRYRLNPQNASIELENYLHGK